MPAHNIFRDCLCKKKLPHPQMLLTNQPIWFSGSFTLSVRLLNCSFNTANGWRGQMEDASTCSQIQIHPSSNLHPSFSAKVSARKHSHKPLHFSNHSPGLVLSSCSDMLSCFLVSQASVQLGIDKVGDTGSFGLLNTCLDFCFCKKTPSIPTQCMKQ